MSFSGTCTTEELALLDCLSSSTSGRAGGSSSIDWAVLLAHARRHRVEFLVRRSYVGSGLVPSEVQADLERAFRINVAIALAQRQLLDSFAEQVDEHGIEVILLKGSGSARYYAQPEDRHVGDLDLLFRDESQAQRAMSLFEAMGWRPLAFDFELNGAQRAEYVDRVKDVALVNEQMPFRLELHWRPFTDSRWWPHAGEEMWPSVPPALDDDLPFPTLPPAIEFRYLLMHGSLCGWFRLKWLADILRILESSDDKQRHDMAMLRDDVHFGLHYRTLSALLKALVDRSLPGDDEWHENRERRGTDWRVRAILQKLDAKPPHEINAGSAVDVVLLKVRERLYSAGLESTWSRRLQTFIHMGFTTRDWEWIRIPERYHSCYRVLTPVLLAARVIRSKRRR